MANGRIRPGDDGGDSRQTDHGGRRERRPAPSGDGELSDGDPGDRQDGQRRDDEDDLVGGSEGIHRPVLERQRHEVDDLLTDGDDRRHRSVDDPDEELPGGQTGAGRHDSDRCTCGSADRRGTRSFRAPPGPVTFRAPPGPGAPYDRSPMDTGLSDSLAALVAAAVEVSDNPSAAKLAQEMLESAVGLIGDRPDTLDLKIAAAALAEMREAFSVFAPYRDVPKVTVFGSARTATNDPLYAQATEIAKLLAERGWMVVTGAGPGIMQAAMEGAGRERSIGVSIRLPFEQGANPVIAGDEKYVSMKYFFTRKLILVKESRAFVCLPGGFGTLDETFELLTLTQTGKGLPVPIIFLDMEGDPFWESVDELVRNQLVTRNLVSAADTHLYYVTDSCADACREIERFYANYDSIRYVGNQAIIRLQTAPTDEQLALLSEQFAHLIASGRVERTEPAPRRASPCRSCRAAAHPFPVRQTQVRRPPRDDRHAQLVRRRTSPRNRLCVSVSDRRGHAG